ncbi:hypothetical protein [Oxynema aestuarii]|jgi:hypothetical protein|uniref:Uncharacterized protein n=1 Tax=Oxynema aestuarii AP17 TaxID=2064643 RepID=A0A6H1U605_9CYAN|nr:hypothetical protein [Oxynema aestuarii]QIZ73463.1 hypothetical protein HCG48_25045 [Oxynema aestuarii AP17]RMH71328.1 MAG: hypothetical protein D6680_21850 [Cyanobacteria bacterium J007]
MNPISLLDLRRSQTDALRKNQLTSRDDSHARFCCGYILQNDSLLSGTIFEKKVWLSAKNQYDRAIASSLVQLYAVFKGRSPLSRIYDNFLPQNCIDRPNLTSCQNNAPRLLWRSRLALLDPIFKID